MTDGEFKERGEDGSSIVFTALDELPSKLFLKTAVSKTRAARSHFSKRLKLRRARRSLEDVTSHLLGEMRWRKMGNVALLIAGVTFLTKLNFARCTISLLARSRYWSSWPWYWRGRPSTINENPEQRGFDTSR
jgi:hypothetical protein